MAGTSGLSDQEALQRQTPGRRDLVGGVVERKKKKLARSEGEQVLGANRASKMTV